MDPRDPFPDRLIWETDDPERNGRAFWVVIHQIGSDPGPDPDPLNTVLFPDLDPPTRSEAFPRRGPSGRMDLRRDGHPLRVETHNVRRFEILFGVDEFDPGRSVEIVVDGVARVVTIPRDRRTVMGDGAGLSCMLNRMDWKTLSRMRELRGEIEGEETHA